MKSHSVSSLIAGLVPLVEVSVMGLASCLDAHLTNILHHQFLAPPVSLFPVQEQVLASLTRLDQVKTKGRGGGPSPALNGLCGLSSHYEGNICSECESMDRY